MDAYDAIITRRSIRKFTSEKVTDDQLEAVLKAAMMAPSAGNQQPWHFIVLQNRSKMDEMTELHPYVSMIKSASCAIIVLGDTSLEKYPGYWAQDCSAATQNMLLAIHSMGLGAVWCGIYPRGDRVEAFRNYFKLPDNIYPLCIIPIGYPAEEKEPPDRFHESRIHLDQW